MLLYMLKSELIRDQVMQAAHFTAFQQSVIQLEAFTQNCDRFSMSRGVIKKKCTNVLVSLFVSLKNIFTLHKYKCKRSVWTLEKWCGRDV